MPIVNIDNLLEVGVKNRINRLGVELEGGWNTPSPPAYLERDGSVTIQANERIHVGEIPSPPKIPASMWTWMRNNYPTHTNNTCGLHVHMSFGENLRYYQILITPDYQDTLIEYLKWWAREENLPASHPIWPRLEGKNRYCELKYWPDAQIRQRSKSYSHEREGHRYTAVNYCFGKENCQTVEVRVLPMFDNVDLAIRAVKAVMRITNACLVQFGRKEAKASETFQIADSNDLFVESSIEMIR